MRNFTSFAKNFDLYPLVTNNENLINLQKLLTDEKRKR